jgi:hypothetical protein
MTKKNLNAQQKSLKAKIEFGNACCDLLSDLARVYAENVLKLPPYSLGRSKIFREARQRGIIE